MPKGGTLVGPEPRVPVRGATPQLRLVLLGLAVIVAAAFTAGVTTAHRTATARTLASDLRLAIVEAEPSLPRVRVNDASYVGAEPGVPPGPVNNATSGGSSWVADESLTEESPGALRDYEDLLLEVNQDGTAPLCRLSPISLMQTGDQVDASTTATCTGFLGRTWSTLIVAGVNLHRYRHR